MAGLATPRMAALRPGQSPPLVRMPMQRARLEDGIGTYSRKTTRYRRPATETTARPQTVKDQEEANRRYRSGRAGRRWERSLIPGKPTGTSAVTDGCHRWPSCFARGKTSSRPGPERELAPD